MDIINFHNPISPTKMEQAEVINGLKSKMWIERYRDAGEFTIVAPATKDMREKLSIGSLISHIDTYEIMIVENHEISSNQDNEPELVITGRGFETFLENRIIGTNQTFPGTLTQWDYFLGEDWAQNQAFGLIINHILASSLLNDNYAVPFVSVLAEWPTNLLFVDGLPFQYIKRVNLYDEVLKILEIENLGIKIVRPGPWSPLEPGVTAYPTIYSDLTPGNIAIVIHKGANRTGAGTFPQVLFSHDIGEIVSGEYLWSNKRKKNDALVTGKWLEVVINPTETGYNRRMIFVDAHDIDDSYDTMPTGNDYNFVLAALRQRGLNALASLNEVALTKVEVSKDSVKSIFRKDYFVGDLISVRGDYNESVNMRVTEYVEIEDENGENGYPTLTMD